MRIRSRLVWKLSAVVVVILFAAIAFCGYVNNLICDHYSLESARAFLKFNSESIINGIGQLMMNRNNQAIEELIGEISQDSTVYGNVRLVSHHSGDIVVSRFSEDDGKLELDNWACAVCHDRPDLGGTEAEIVDAVFAPRDGSRFLSVMAPILNEPGCRTADCHAHAAGPSILGFLTADYSLDRVDAMVADRTILIVVTVLVSLLLGAAVLWLMFERLLQKPISELIAGTQRIAAHQLDFRFDQNRNDEIGVLEASFNTMTSRIQAHREELRSTMEYLAGIVENSADLIITVTPDGFIETFNRGAEQVLGYRRAEVIGQPIEMLFVDPSERDAAIALLKTSSNVRNYEIRFLAKDGQVRDVLLTLSYLRDREGNPIGTMGISKDVTQEKELQRELVQSQKFVAIGQAVTGIQHAIKNMLNGLKGGSYLIRNGMAKGNRQRIEEGSEMIEESIERISGLSHSMLDYAREWKLDLQKVDLNDIVKEICEQNRQAAADRGVTLRCEVPHGLPAVPCDPKLIHMATTDIVVNAIDACAWKDYASGENPEVIVKNALSEDGGRILIEVRDNGCGMSEEVKRNVFTPFFSTKKMGGTGLGLALTARIIKVLTGEVSVESEPDRGTTFRIHLPIDGPKGH